MTQRNQKGREEEQRAEPAPEPTVKEVSAKYEAKLEVSQQAYAKQAGELTAALDSLMKLQEAYNALKKDAKGARQRARKWQKRATKLAFKLAEAD